MKTNAIKNLLRAYFIENWKKDLFQFVLIVGGISLLSNLMQPEYYYGGFEVFTAVVLLFFYPDRVFDAFNNTSKSIHYLMIPANSRDKLIVSFLLVNVYAVIAIVCSVLLGYSIGYMISSFRGIENLGSFMERYSSDDYGTIILSTYTMLSLFFFGSIYFKRRQTVKTIAVSLLIFFALTLLSLLTVLVNARLTLHKSMMDIVYSFNFAIDKMFVFEVLCVIIIVVSYTLSFIRFRETEA